jgi:hypothetical protein
VIVNDGTRVREVEGVSVGASVDVEAELESGRGAVMLGLLTVRVGNTEQEMLAYKKAQQASRTCQLETPLRNCIPLPIRPV